MINGPSGSRVVSGAFILLCVVLSSCALLRPTMGVGVLKVSTQTLKNGYLIQIRIDRPTGPVSAALTRGNWLLVTFADSLLDAEAVESLTSEFIDSLEVHRFPSALQLAFHLTVAVDALEVIHPEPSTEVLISLFAPRGQQGENTGHESRTDDAPPHRANAQRAFLSAPWF